MKVALSIVIIAIILVVPFELAAAQKTIRLICKYTHTIDDQGKTTGTSGEDLVTVDYSENGSAIIKKQGLGAEFSGTVNEEEIRGETRYKIQSLVFHQTLTINRYTGAFEITFGVEGEKAGLIQYGKCKPETQRLF
jgi:hypothetical protein